MYHKLYERQTLAFRLAQWHSEFLFAHVQCCIQGQVQGAAFQGSRHKVKPHSDWKHMSYLDNVSFSYNSILVPWKMYGYVKNSNDTDLWAVIVLTFYHQQFT